ncbi:MAG: 4-hydroxy-tetrahydrodipicolinate reductase [Bacteroidetes bacterium]|jgi:4-hydroxy-tetrahydrodipicolinate reductase|nr:4-hydroxy-tetrahydrodipicolinate reductase [Bacteroidota bacterium]MDA1019041.1 4-hydroxy-tetrahydrodipicolinate reductase [Bacteroidota bacterium]|tara:strand:+ start:7076 stop:7783 length:708 start_codon:yes stop_codon:yes gene_type:complete
MNIALLGYGKMGKEIEQIAIERGHKIICKIEKGSNIQDLNEVDVAINFSTPQAAFENISKALNSSIPVICGTTGWLNNYKEVVKLSNKTNTSFLYSSNFSLGVNLFFELNKKLASIMKNHNQYVLYIEEVHHKGKLDKPSGTAITIAEDVVKKSNYKKWSFNKIDKNIIKMISKRIDEVPGTHILKYDSDIDSIEIKHTAKNRKGFALGAVIAAEWILNKKGVFEMRDVINDFKF